LRKTRITFIYTLFKHTQHYKSIYKTKQKWFKVPFKSIRVIVQVQGQANGRTGNRRVLDRVRNQTWQWNQYYISSCAFKFLSILFVGHYWVRTFHFFIFIVLSIPNKKKCVRNIELHHNNYYYLSPKPEGRLILLL